jgi:1,4-alpha-glucan branching enzyme
VKDQDLKYQYLAAFDREMVRLQSDHRVLDDLYIGRIYENNYDKVAAYTRGDLLFVFNFHPANSFTDYGIPVKGKYRILIDSDDPAFGGFDRVDRSTLYLSMRKASRQTLNMPFYLYLYLPSRTALVLKREPVKKVTDL